MSEVTPNQSEEAPAKLPEGGESEDQKEFDALFAEIDLDEEKSVEELKADIDAFKEESKKNFAKFYSEKGMELAKKKKEEAATPPGKTDEVTLSDLELVFFENKPEVDFVKDDLKKIAEAKGISLVQAWKSESWLVEKAKALHAEKQESEENKGKVGDPSPIPTKGMTEVQKIAQRLSGNLPPGFSADKPKI